VERGEGTIRWKRTKETLKLEDVWPLHKFIFKLEDENGRGKMKEPFGWVRKKEKDEDTGLLV